MLNRLVLKNYRTFDNVTIPFKHITVLVGKNRTGKTTIMKLLSSFRIKRGMPNIDYDYDHNSDSPIDIILSGEISDKSKFKHSYKIYFKYKFNTSNDFTFDGLVIPTISGKNMFPLITVKYNTDMKNQIPSIRGSYYDGFSPQRFADEFKHHRQHNHKVYSLIHKFLTEYRYVPINRYFSRSSTTLSDEPDDDSLAEIDENAIIQILTYKEKISDKLYSILKDIMGVDLKLGFKEQKRVNINVKNNAKNVNILDDGSGLHAILYIVLALVKAPTHSTVCIDEPELSLYPNLQKKFFNFMRDYANEKQLQLIITTHSIHIITAASKHLDTDTSILHLELNDDNKTKITQMGKDATTKLLQSDFGDWGNS